MTFTSVAFFSLPSLSPNTASGEFNFSYEYFVQKAVGLKEVICKKNSEFIPLHCIKVTSILVTVICSFVILQLAQKLSFS
jgi:hypothetical protein